LVNQIFLSVNFTFSDKLVLLLLLLLLLCKLSSFGLMNPNASGSVAI